jgi:hemerythrin-like domain-containing protein
MATRKKTTRNNSKNGRRRASSSRSARSSIDATSFLKKEHAEVREKLEEATHSNGRTARPKQSLVDQIRQDLMVHTQIEEEIFYPAIAELRGKDGPRLVAEAHEEHALVKQVLGEIEEVSSDSESKLALAAKLKVLKDLVLHHVKEEESEIFKLVKKEMSKDELRELGERLESRKMELMETGVRESRRMPGARAPSMGANARL